MHRIIKTKIISLLLLPAVSMAYYGKNSQIYDETGIPVSVNGVSWSGFQDTNIFQGLQSNPFYAMPNGTHQAKDAGLMDLLIKPDNQAPFKSVRLPIQPGVLYDDTSTADLNLTYTNKHYPQQGNGIFCQSWQTNGQACQKAVSPKKAFWIVLEEFKKNNIKVLIDFHHRYGYGDGYRDGTVYDINQYQKDLRLLLTEVKKRDLDNVIGIDVFNEPHQLHWFKANGNQVPWTKVIAVAANVTQEIVPEVLLFVEGPNGGSNDADNPVICIEPTLIVDDPNGYAHHPDPAQCGNLHRVFFKGNWGEDFKPLLNQSQAKKGIRQFDKAKFNQELLKQGINHHALAWLMGDADLKSHIIFSPHVYPAEVAGWQTKPGAASNLRFDWTWGFLHQAGYPVVLGEASWKTDQGKSFFMDAVMNYLQDRNMMTSYLYFWAIGFLGDTVSAINPHTGVLNSDVQHTLAPFYGKTAQASESVKVFFNQNINENISINILINGKRQSCHLLNGCQFNLVEGHYSISVEDHYYHKDSNAVYKIHHSNNLALTISAGKENTIVIPLSNDFVSQVFGQKITINTNFIDNSGHSIAPSFSMEPTLLLKSDANQYQCNMITGCQLTTYNTNINSQGDFLDRSLTLIYPQTITDNQGKLYIATQGPSIITISGNESKHYPVAITYQQQQEVNNNANCQAQFTVNNWWHSGAVLQGSIRNTSDKPITAYQIKVKLSPENVKVINAWLGNDSSYQQTPDGLILSAKPYDNYNGLLPQQSQSIGFQIESNGLNQAPKIIDVSCQ